MEINGTVSVLLHQKDQTLWSIDHTVTVYEAISIMAERGIGALPVLRHGKLIGVITERDYTRKVVLHGRSSKSTSVAEIMSGEPVVARPDDSLAHCMEVMTEHRIRHIPVLDGDELIGIVSIGDLVKWIISSQTATIDQLTRYVFGE